MRIFKKNIGLVLLFVLIILMMLFSLNSCSKNQNTIESPNSAEIQTAEDISEESQNNDTEATETEDEIVDGSESEDIEDSQDTEKENIVTFKGNKVNDNTALMIIEIDTQTGKIKGVLQMGFKSFDMDMDSTKICDYVLTGNITGNLDFNSMKITGILKGNAKAQIDTSGCSDYAVNYDMIASVLEDFTQVKGYFETKSMENYGFFLKEV